LPPNHCSVGSAPSMMGELEAVHTFCKSLKGFHISGRVQFKGGTSLPFNRRPPLL